MLLNSLVWTCSLTGKINLTYTEALLSEKSARKSLKRLPKHFIAPMLIVAKLTKRAGLKSVTEDIFSFISAHFLKNEKVCAIETTNSREIMRDCLILDVIAPSTSSNSNMKTDPKKIKYKVKRVDSTIHNNIWTVTGDKVRRRRFIITKDLIKLLLRKCTEIKDGIVMVTDDAYKKYVLNEILNKFEDYFVGKPPVFGGQSDNKNDTINKTSKQQSIAKYLTKDNNTMTKEMLRKMEENENLRRKLEKEKEDERKCLAAERERQRLEFLHLVQSTVKHHNQLRDDLELQDQKPLPTFKPIKSLIPMKYFGDALMVLEFMHSFSSILADKDKFSNGINLQIIERAIICREVAGPLSDIIQVLLCTIFSLQIEESNEIPIIYLNPSKIIVADPEKNIIQWNIKNATNTASYSKKYYSTHIEELPMDATTLSELLRLHLLMSGAKVCVFHILPFIKDIQFIYYYFRLMMLVHVGDINNVVVMKIQMILVFCYA